MEQLFFYWLVATASPLPPARECIMWNEQKQCVLWYERTTGNFYNNEGQVVSPPWN